MVTPLNHEIQMHIKQRWKSHTAGQRERHRERYTTLSLLNSSQDCAAQCTAICTTVSRN